MGEGGGKILVLNLLYADTTLDNRRKNDDCVVGDHNNHFVFNSKNTHWFFVAMV